MRGRSCYFFFFLCISVTNTVLRFGALSIEFHIREGVLTNKLLLIGRPLGSMPQKLVCTGTGSQSAVLWWLHKQRSSAYMSHWEESKDSRASPSISRLLKPMLSLLL